MKKMRKLVALVFSLAMMLALGMTSMAAETYTITGPADGHTYEVYQIFTGDLNGTTLSNVKWGANGIGTVGAAVDDATLSTIAGLANKTQATADAVSAYVTGSPIGTIDNTTTSLNVVPGYYLIKDKGATSGSTDAYSTNIVSVVKDLTIEPKKDVPSFEKKVQDINDTTDAKAGDLQDSADYDIGDDVPFTLTGTVADNYADYTHYYFEFQDSMEESLTFNKDSVKVTIDGKAVDSSKYEVKTGTVTDGLGGDSFSVIFTDLKNTDAKAGDKVVVTYTAKLNEKAVLGSQGNVNEAKLVYSNNPNDKQSGKPETPGETPWDNVIVFTYKVVVNKVDSSKAPLEGAEFTLTKKMNDGSTKEIAKDVTLSNATSFVFKGLDDGEYTLTETKTPAGYNTIDPISFKVTAEHKIEWTTEARTDILTSLSGDKVQGEITLSSNKSEGSLTSDIVNKKGSELPSTGGIGTTVFYVIGGILMIGAAVLLISRRRVRR